MSTNEDIEKNELYRIDNKYLINIILTKKYIPNNIVEEISITKDGNCFYSNLSYFFTGKEKYNNYFRELTYKYLMANKINIILETPYTYYNDQIIEIDKYIDNIKNNAFYAGDLELSKIIDLLKINIAFYKK